MPATPGLRQTRPRMPQQQAPTPGRQEAMQATPYQQQVFPPKCPAPNRAPPPVPARIMETWLEKLEAPGVGPHPEGLRIGKEGADPPPKDPRSTDGAPPVTV